MLPEAARSVAAIVRAASARGAEINAEGAGRIAEVEVDGSGEIAGYLHGYCRDRTVGRRGPEFVVKRWPATLDVLGADADLGAVPERRDTWSLADRELESLGGYRDLVAGAERNLDLFTDGAEPNAVDA